MALYLNILTAVLLALVAGLLLMVSFQLRAWRSNNAQAPLLAEKLTEAIMSARKGLADLKVELITQGPEISRLTTEASKMRVELQFMIQRGEQMAGKLEHDTSRRPTLNRVEDDEDDIDLPVVRLAPGTQAVVEQVSVANGLAAKPVQASQHNDGDDALEALLATLHSSDDTIKRGSSKRKRVGPITQAELDLQQSLKDVA